MAVILVLTISVLLQFAAAFGAVVLLRRFGGRLVWITLGTALFMMGVRRSLSLYHAIENYPYPKQNLETELVALVISALVVVAMASIRPLIDSIRRSERQLKEETQRNDIILETSPDGFCITTTRGIIQEVNPAYCQMLQRDKEEIVGKHFQSFISINVPEQSLTCVEQIVTQGHGRFEITQVTKAGQPVFMELIGRRVKDDEHDFVYLFLRDITERKIAVDELNQFKNTLDHTLDCVFMFCPSTLRFTYCNEGAIKHIGYSRQQLMQMSPVDIKPEFNEEGFRQMILPMMRGERSAINFETLHEDRHGRHIPVEIFLQYIVLEDESPRFVAIVRDITERYESQARLYEEKEKAQVTLASIGDGVITTNIEGQIEFMNQAAEELCGTRLPHAVGKPLLSVCNFIDERNQQAMESPITQVLEKQGPIYLSQNVALRDKDGTHYSVEVVVSPILDSDESVVGAVLVIHDITELRGMAQQLSYQASHDSLTGLINRREFEARLTNTLLKVRHEKTPYALFYMDLDQFKIINDTCGHVAGDEMLIQITQVLQHCMRETDTLARLGGDEFGVLLENCSITQARKVAEKIRNAVSSYRFVWQDNIFEIGVSIGIVPIDEDSGTISDLLSAADSACYVAKERGRNTAHVYVSGDKALALHHGQMQWYQRIQRALEEERLQLYMQSIQPLKKSEKPHCEILLRMVGDDGAMISPGLFLPAAERYHMANALDKWVVRNVFAVLANNNSRLSQADCICGINLSGQSLGNIEFHDYIYRLLDEYQIDSQRLCFEVTETAVIGNIEQARRFIASIRDRGGSFALDDFGSGLSSFSYLKNLDVDYLKIDGSFVRNMLQDKNDYNMVKTINHIGQILGLKTIAEFVETEALIDALAEMGVDFVQGFALDMPAPV